MDKDSIYILSSAKCGREKLHHKEKLPLRGGELRKGVEGGGGTSARGDTLLSSAV